MELKIQGEEAPLTFQGNRVFICHIMSPRMQLSEDCPVTPDFRVEMNQWMSRFFGVVPLIPDGTVWQQGNCVYVNKATYHKLVAAMQKEQALSSRSFIGKPRPGLVP